MAKSIFHVRNPSPKPCSLKAYSCQTPDAKHTKNLNADMYTTNHLVSTISIFGDTVNTAARMEQTCLPYMVHLTRAAAIRLVEEMDMSAEDEEEKITEDSIHWSEMQVSLGFRI